MAEYGYSKILAEGAAGTMAGGSLSSGATSLTLTETNFGTLPAAPFYLELDGGTARMEMVKCTAVAGNVLTITRAQKGTAAVAHPFPFVWRFGYRDQEIGQLVGTLP